jgi:hypothetical protein
MIRLLLPMFSIRRRLAAWISSVIGRLQFGLGSLASARRSFERVLELKGDDFTAYVYLARIAYRYRDVEESMREFENARRTDPERFVRLRLPLELHRADLASLGEFPSERTCWSPVPVSHRSRPRHETEEGDPDQDDEGDPGDLGRFSRTHGHLGSGPMDPRLRGDEEEDDEEEDLEGEHGRTSGRRRRSDQDPASMGDFVSAAEAKRFRDRSPIRREEIANLDWTRFMREVTRSASGPWKGRPGKGRAEPGQDPED